MFIIAQIQTIRDNLNRLLGKVKVTDGTNEMPTMDAASRRGYEQITDGTNSAAVSATDKALQAAHIPTRPTCDLGAACILIAHGVVAADWSADVSAGVTPTSGYNLYITDAYLQVDQDPTAEIAVQHIPVEFRIRDETDSENMLFATLGIPDNTQVHFETPIKIAAGHQYKTVLKLGGATALNLNVVINGFEEAS